MSDNKIYIIKKTTNGFKFISKNKTILSAIKNKNCFTSEKCLSYCTYEIIDSKLTECVKFYKQLEEDYLKTTNNTLLKFINNFYLILCNSIKEKVNINEILSIRYDSANNLVVITGRLEI